MLLLLNLIYVSDRVAQGGVVETGVRRVGARREVPTAMVTKATPGSSSVRRVAVLLPPRAPPLDGDGNGGVGRWGWREGVSSRLACAASELGLPHHRDGDYSEND